MGLQLRHQRGPPTILQQPSHIRWVLRHTCRVAIDAAPVGFLVYLHTSIFQNAIIGHTMVVYLFMQCISGRHTPRSPVIGVTSSK